MQAYYNGNSPITDFGAWSWIPLKMTIKHYFFVQKITTFKANGSRHKTTHSVGNSELLRAFSNFMNIHFITFYSDLKILHFDDELSIDLP